MVADVWIVTGRFCPELRASILHFGGVLCLARELIMGNVWSKLGNTSSPQDGIAENLASPIKDVAEVEELLDSLRKAKDTSVKKLQLQSEASYSSESPQGLLQTDSVTVSIADAHDGQSNNQGSGSTSSTPFNVNDTTQLNRVLNRVFDFIPKKEQPARSRHDRLLEYGIVGAPILVILVAVLEPLASALAREGIRQVKEPQSSAFKHGGLQVLRNLHWFVLAVVLIVGALQPCYKMKKNSDACWKIVEVLDEDVRRMTPHLGKAYPYEVDRIKAVISILKAVIMCVKHLRYGFISRFYYANANATEDGIKESQDEIAKVVQKLDNAADKNKPLSFPKTTGPQGTVGLEEKVAEVLSILGVAGKEIQPGVRAILLYGMGGIGKTTLGREVCAKIPIHDKYAQVEVGWKPTNEKICHVQGLICQCLFGTQPKISTWEDGQKQLQDLGRTCTTPVLLFIDNVFRRKDLSRLLPCNLDLPDGSCIIVTSRDRIVLEALQNSVIQYHSYEVQKLQKSESKTLFDDIVGGCPPDKEQLSSSVLQKCDGWPLALRLVGGYLKRKKNDPDAWNDTLDCLCNCEAISSRSEDDIIEILHWTYERLDKNAQNLFLDACLLRNQPWEWIESLGRSNALDCLQDLSLVKKSERRSEMIFGWMLYGRSKGRIEIHDLFFSYGRRATPSSPKTRICIGDRTEILSCLQNNVEGSCSHVEGLVTKYGAIAVLPTKLDEMHQTLRILVLGSYAQRVQGQCIELPQKLQICVAWCRFPYSSLSGLNELCVLEITSDVQFDFKTVLFPRSLKILRLFYVRSLQSFHPDAFTLCTALHTVEIISCEDLTEVPASFCSLEKLRFLQLDWNVKLLTLPGGFCRLKSLETLSVTYSMKELPSGVSSLISLRKLDLNRIHCLPNNLNLSSLTQLEDLYFGRDVSVEPQLLDGIGNLKKLRTLALRCCDRVERLPEDFSQLTSLENLSLERCTRLAELPTGFGNLKKLHQLKLKLCNIIERLPENFPQLTSLETLSLSDCKRLAELPTGFGNLKKLHRLELGSCGVVERLPEDFSQLTSLAILILSGCKRLEELPTGIGNLKKLCQLELGSSGIVERLPAYVPQLTSLEKLSLSNCQRLVELPTGIGNLKKLRQLELGSCGIVERLPKDFPRLTSLERLSLSECKRLAELPTRFGELKRLSTLELRGCESLSELPDGFCKLSSLRELSMENCKSLKRLPGGFYRLPLVKLTLHECESLEQLPDAFSKLTSLHILQLTGCMSLTNLPEGFTDLRRLLILELSECENLCHLPNDFSNLESLGWLRMDGCKSLSELPSGFGRLPNLCELSLKGCVGLGELPSDFGDLRYLQYLTLDGCVNLEPLLEKDECFIDKLNGINVEALSEEDERFMNRLVLICSVFSLPKLRSVSVEGCNDLLQAFHSCEDYSSKLASALASVKEEGYSPLLQVLRHHIIPREAYSTGSSLE